MKTTLLLIFIFCFIRFTFVLDTAAQDSPQWGLPEDAKVRLGKGAIEQIVTAEAIADTVLDVN